MLKLSKNYIVKKAEDEQKENNVLQGADVQDDINEGYSDDEELDAGEAEDNAKDKKYDARREAATPHANAAKDLYSKRRELMSQVSMLDDELAKHREVLRALDPKMKHESYADDKELRDYLKPEKTEKDKKKKKKLDKKTQLEVVDGLLKVAEVLDYAGYGEDVSLIEDMLQVFADKSKEYGMPKYDVKVNEKKERKYPETEPYAPTMSTRGCPDHHGAQMRRIAEGIFQCELDGKTYNWNKGFTTLEGDKYPPAQISGVDFPPTSTALFENRDMALSKRMK